MWNIVGDAEVCGKIETCLMWVAGNTKEEAEATLKRIQANPDKYQKQRLAQHINVRVKEDKDPWYFDSRNFRD